MKPERWQEIEKLYHEALKRPEAEQAGFLDKACAGDEELRREVESLLGYDGKAQDFIESPAVEAAARAWPRSRPDRSWASSLVLTRS